MKINIEDLEKAAEEAALLADIQTAEEKAQAMGKSFFPDIIKKLKRSGADKALIAELEKEISKSTDKNTTLLNFYQKCNNTANAILKLVKKAVK
ncbi:hypothetical protein HR11_10380 [Porphyromonas macacae]|uniref:hypothetical protein n=1 Tax=Porphyromonas macacae TaxID=28115 RepID=UPI00052D50CF|nr:hypothetical protein [Porphyromonas macacae]KGN96995.1 hypothetical protein HR11_10380 [Porphyromonas macacae]